MESSKFHQVWVNCAGCKKQLLIKKSIYISLSLGNRRDMKIIEECKSKYNRNYKYDFGP